MNNFLIALTDRDKKILAVLAIIFVLGFIIIGALYQVMRARMKKNGEKIDSVVFHGMFSFAGGYALQTGNKFNKILK